MYTVLFAYFVHYLATQRDGACNAYTPLVEANEAVFNNAWIISTEYKTTQNGNLEHWILTTKNKKSPYNHQKS